jgi:hypothetical protein
MEQYLGSNLLEIKGARMSEGEKIEPEMDTTDLGYMENGLWNRLVGIWARLDTEIQEDVYGV